MKKILFAMALAAAVLVSCDEQKPAENIAPSEQKSKLEEVAQDVMDEYPASEFNEFFDLAGEFYETYGENYNWDPFLEYCENKGEQIFVSDDATSVCEFLLEFADLNGLLILGENGASCVDYEGTKMVFSLGGNNYETEVSTEGNEVKAVYSYTEEGKEYLFDVDVPEKLNVVIKKNGADYAKVQLGFEMRFTEDGVNVNTDSFKMTATVSIGEHSFVLERSGYDANSKNVSFGCTVKKGNRVIVQTNVAAEVQVRLDENFDNLELVVGKGYEINVDLLGKLQIRGKGSDIRSVYDNVNSFFEAETAQQAERAVDNINNYVDLGLYYDGDQTRQAELVTDYYPTEYGFALDLLIQFSDGSKYAFFEYFNEDSFSGTINSLESWLEMYETTLERYF